MLLVSPEPLKQTMRDRVKLGRVCLCRGGKGQILQQPNVQMPRKMKIRSITFYPSDINASDTTLLIIDAEIQSSKKDGAAVYTLSNELQGPVAQYQIRKQLKATLDAGDAQEKACGWQCIQSGKMNYASCSCQSRVYH